MKSPARAAGYLLPHAEIWPQLAERSSGTNIPPSPPAAIGIPELLYKCPVSVDGNAIKTAQGASTYKPSKPDAPRSAGQRRCCRRCWNGCLRQPAEGSSPARGPARCHVCPDAGPLRKSGQGRPDRQTDLNRIMSAGRGLSDRRRPDELVQVKLNEVQVSLNPLQIWHQSSSLTFESSSFCFESSTPSEQVQVGVAAVWRPTSKVRVRLEPVFKLPIGVQVRLEPAASPTTIKPDRAARIQLALALPGKPHRRLGLPVRQRRTLAGQLA